MHRQVRVALGKLVDKLRLKRVIDGRPQRQAVLFALLNVFGGQDAGGFGLELGLHVGREEGAESTKAVDGAGNAVEGNAFEADFANKFGGGGGAKAAVVGCRGVGGDGVEDAEGVGRVKGEGCCSLEK